MASRRRKACEPAASTRYGAAISIPMKKIPMPIRTFCLPILAMVAWTIFPVRANVAGDGTAPPVPAYVSAAGFRASFPEPAGLDDAIAAFDKANAILLVHAQGGATAQVALAYPDGSTSYGRDYFFNGNPIRLHEIRAGYESIAIGDDVCTRDTGKSWNCIQDSFWIGLRPLIREAIVSWSHAQFPCEHGTCDGYRVVQADAYYQGDNLVINSDPSANHYEFAIFISSDGSPLMSSESRTIDGRIAEPIGSFLYDFQSPVASFDLPMH